MAVGGDGPAGSKSAEMYEFSTDKWMTVSDYPSGRANPSVSNYCMVFMPETSSYLVIGGFNSGELTQIAKFTNGAWSAVGGLNKARSVSFESFLFFWLFILL